MAESIGIIGIVTSSILTVFLLLLGIIGYFFSGRMKSIDTSLKCLPEIQVELAGMKVKVEQQSEKQDDFCENQDEHGKRLAEIEKHISNTERIAVLEKSVSTLEHEQEKLRPMVHKIPTLQQTVDHLVAEGEKRLAGKT